MNLLARSKSVLGHRRPLLHQFIRLKSSLSDALSRSPSRTPLENQFETWTHLLKPGEFTTADVDTALRSQVDPDLALDIFRWTSQQRHYKHDHTTYHTMLESLIQGKRHKQAESLIDEILAGACNRSPPLFNAVIHFCFSRKPLFSRGFDVYKKMYASEDCKPDLRTYSLLIGALLRKFSNKGTASFVYLHAVRSLYKQMNAAGIMPDLHLLNMVIKAFCFCREVDEALRVFRELGLYDCSPNGHTYGYMITAMCEKGRVSRAVEFYKEMRGKEIHIPNARCLMILISSLALDRRVNEAFEVMSDMLELQMSPDFLTYKTLLEAVCNDGDTSKAFDLLEEWRRRDGKMGEKAYKYLLDNLHFINEN